MKFIKASFNFEEFESALKSVRGDHELALPSEINHMGHWGVETALVQLLLTWARLHESRKLRLYLSDSDAALRKTQLEQLGRRMHGIVAMYLASRVTTAKGVAYLPREEYWPNVLPTMDGINACDIFNPDSVKRTYLRNTERVAAQFICIHGEKYELPDSLYDRNVREGFISRTQFGALLESSLAPNKYFRECLAYKPALTNALANIAFELFQNTTDHAYDDLHGKSFATNVRALLIKEHSGQIAHGHLSDMKSTNAVFNRYLDRCKTWFQESGGNMYHFLEISVVDGGLGIAQQFSKVPLSKMTVEEEKAVTVRCFKKGVSSKGPQSRGEGLDEVWKALREVKGFIRLRTGRVCLFQVFDCGEDTPTAFKNWSNKPLSEAVGTAVTIIIPCLA